MNGTRLVVGSPFESAAGFSGAGHAYVYNTTGTLFSTLTSPNAQANGKFGSSVAAGSASIVVGASGEIVANTQFGGHVYVYSVTGSLISTLTSPNTVGGGNGEAFGTSVAVVDTVGHRTVTVGAPSSTVNGLMNRGRVYLYTMKS
jgi:hypothetical protein